MSTEIPKLLLVSGARPNYMKVAPLKSEDSGSVRVPPGPHRPALRPPALRRVLRRPGPTAAGIRFGTLFGFSPRMRHNLVLNTFARDAWQGHRLTVHAGGEVWRPLLHARDATDAVLAAAYAPEAAVHGQVFNIVHKNYWIQSLAHRVNKVLEDRAKIDIDVDYEGQAEARGYRVSTDKAKAVLGFSADQGITAALEKVWGLFEEGRYTDFDNSIYYNIRWMKTL